MKTKRRVMVKITGEGLSSKEKNAFDDKKCIEVAKQIKQALSKGIQVAVVIGGGNFWRGRQNDYIDRYKADQIGMLATVMNCLYLAGVLKELKVESSIYCSFECGDMVKLFNKDSAIEDLNNKKVVFCAGGTGHPYFTTDTAVALRALELECDEMILAKSIDAVYDCDPTKNKNAKKYKTISIKEMVDKKLGVVDLTCSILCLENKLPFRIFSLDVKNSIYDSLCGKDIGTKITV
jgi:uridylate kinase